MSSGLPIFDFPQNIWENSSSVDNSSIQVPFADFEYLPCNSNQSIEKNIDPLQQNQADKEVFECIDININIDDFMVRNDYSKLIFVKLFMLTNIMNSSNYLLHF